MKDGSDNLLEHALAYARRGSQDALIFKEVEWR